MLDVFQSVFLGIIQGITEWLPISSSGHLAIAQHYLGLDFPVAFSLLLHLATTLVVILFFRKDIIGILSALARRDFKSPAGRMFIYIIIGGIPTAAIGLGFRSFFKSMPTNMLAIGAAFLVASVIIAASRFGKGNRKLDGKLAFIIGAGQGIGIAPGISRSGATISTALIAGLERREAVRYSFLLAVPTLLAAMLLETGDLALSGIPVASLATGFIASFIVGYLSLKLLIKVVMQKRFWWFAVYCFALGAVLLIIGL